MSACLTVIPARLGSTRFPGKVLKPLAGRSVVEWCWRAAKAARLGPVVVATEDEAVARHVRGFGGEAVMTPASCASGTDRVRLAAAGRKARVIINLQGDEPLIPSAVLRSVYRLVAGGAPIATAVAPLEPARSADPNVVKAALARDGRALYFSRAPIPFPRGGGGSYWQHFGIYGFSRAALERFVKLPTSPLERTESLEQLRALEAGIPIYAAKARQAAVAIDTPDDLKRAEDWLRRKKK